MLEMHRLRLLRELSARGTIAAAAEACSLTPSAVSQQLAVLQRELGTPLLVRDGRRVLLTEAARVLVRHTERILAEMEAARAEVAALAESVRGVVRLATFPTAASALVPSAIAECRAAHPDLQVRLEEQETAEGIDALKSGRLDLLITYEYNLLPSIADPGIELTPLLRESLLAALPGSLQLPGGRVRLERLKDQPWIAPRSDTALRAALERACGLAGFAPAIDYTSNDYTVILALVGAGLGVSVVPQLATETTAADVRLEPVAEPPLSRTVSVATRAGSAGAPSIGALVAHLRAAAARLNFHPAAR